MVTVISHQSLLEARRTRTVEQAVPYTVLGQQRTATKRITAGEMETFDLSRPVGELMTTPAGLDALVQRSVINLELGREDVPLLYGPLYRRMEDANFTQFVDIAGILSAARVVFVQHLETEEVKFGTRVLGAKEAIEILTYAAGFQWTEDMALYDKTWERAEADRAMGQAYNALLNHLHLFPIIDFDYQPANQQAAVEDELNPEVTVLNLRATIKAALRSAALADVTDAGTGEKVGKRGGRVLLIATANRWDVQEALSAHTVNGTIVPALAGIDQIILYDGYSVQVGDRTYTYPGVDAGKAYLIQPGTWLREIVKHDLRVDADGGDLKRLIEGAMVGRARRAVYAAVEQCVTEITLP